MLSMTMLKSLAFTGLFDIGSALNRRYRHDTECPVSKSVWGPFPTLVIIAVAVGSGVAGMFLERYIRAFVPLPISASFGAVLIFSLICAWRIRGYLPDCPDMSEMDTADKRLFFDGLAVPVIPGIPILLAADTLTRMIVHWETSPWRVPDSFTGMVHVLFQFTEHVLGYGAAVAIIVACFTYSKKQTDAVIDVFSGYIFLKIAITITAFLVIQIAPLSSIVGIVIDSVMENTLPDAMLSLMDQGAYMLLVSLIYLGLIGAVWKVAEENFDELCEKGEFRFLKALEKTVESKDDDEKRKRRKEERRKRRRGRDA